MFLNTRVSVLPTGSLTHSLEYLELDPHLQVFATCFPHLSEFNRQSKRCLVVYTESVMREKYCFFGGTKWLSTKKKKLTDLQSRNFLSY